MGGFDDPQRVEVDPLAESLRPLRDDVASILTRILGQGGFGPTQPFFTGLANPVEQLFPGARLNPQGGQPVDQAPRPPGDERRRGNFQCPEGFELKFMADGSPVCIPTGQRDVNRPEGGVRGEGTTDDGGSVNRGNVIDTTNRGGRSSFSPAVSGSRIINSFTPSFRNQTTTPTFGTELFKLPPVR